MGQAQINVRTRACSGIFIARTKQAALTHNIRGKRLKTIDPPHPRGASLCVNDVATMFVGGSYASLTYFGTRPSDCAKIWHARAVKI